MKTTLNLDDHLLAKVKAAAARERKSLTRLIEEGMNLRLRKPATRVGRPAAALSVFRGKGGLAAGVNPRSNRSLYDAADA